MRTTILTEGNPTRLILWFALPILAGNLFQQLYNVADTMIVGYALGDSALAAVGATGSVYGLFIGFIFGVCNGFSIMVARYFGARDRAKVRHAAAAAIVLGLVLTAVLTLIAIAGTMPLLRLLNTPLDVIESSYAYISVLLSCMICTMLYNLAAGLLRALGNSRAPLLFLVLALILNIVLDILFVVTFGMGVAGAAWATVLSQLLAAALCFIYIVKYCPELHVSRNDFKLKREMLVEMMGIGLSIGFSLSIVQIGSVILQSAINGLGTETITAHTAARRIVDMCMLPLVTMGTASATFASQNLGAGKTERIRAGMRSAVLLSWIWSAIVMIVVFAAGGTLIQLLTGTKDAYVIDNAVRYMRINTPFFFVLSLLFIYRQTLQGMGNKLTPILSSCIELAGKIGVAFSLAPLIGYVGVCIAEPVIWVACTVLLASMFYAKLRETEAVIQQRSSCVCSES